MLLLCPGTNPFLSPHLLLSPFRPLRYTISCTSDFENSNNFLLPRGWRAKGGLGGGWDAGSGCRSGDDSRAAEVRRRKQQAGELKLRERRVSSLYKVRDTSIIISSGPGTRWRPVVRWYLRVIIQETAVFEPRRFLVRGKFILGVTFPRFYNDEGSSYCLVLRKKMGNYGAL